MDDAISRSAALAIINDRSYDTAYPSEHDELVSEINKLPALDVEPVVRCKDCKHYDAGCWCAELERGTAEDFFCTYGERKER